MCECSEDSVSRSSIHPLLFYPSAPLNIVIIMISRRISLSLSTSLFAPRGVKRSNPMIQRWIPSSPFFFSPTHLPPLASPSSSLLFLKKESVRLGKTQRGVKRRKSGIRKESSSSAQFLRHPRRSSPTKILVQRHERYTRRRMREKRRKIPYHDFSSPAPLSPE